MTEALTAWVRFGWNEPFLWRRFATMLGLSLVPTTVCLALGQGVLGLLAMAIGLWPWPLRLRVGSSGLEFRWLFLRQVLPLARITSVRVTLDPRRSGLLRRNVLVLGRTGEADLLVFAPDSTLRKLEIAISG
jgi:hypothetical protein